MSLWKVILVAVNYLRSTFKKYVTKVALLVFLAYLIGAFAIVYDGLNDNVFNADLIIVPGSKVEQDGMPSPRLKARLNTAIELFNQGKAKYIFVSGGFGKEGFDEAVVMSDYLIQQHIPASAIVLDSKGIDTMSTARNASAFMNTQKLMSAIVVTQYFHISRTKLALRALGISNLGCAHAQYFELRDIYSLVREVIAYVSYVGKIKLPRGGFATSDD